MPDIETVGILMSDALTSLQEPVYEEPVYLVQGDNLTEQVGYLIFAFVLLEK